MCESQENGAEVGGVLKSEGRLVLCVAVDEISTWFRTDISVALVLTAVRPLKAFQCLLVRAID